MAKAPQAKTKAKKTTPAPKKPVKKAPPVKAKPAVKTKPVAKAKTAVKAKSPVKTTAKAKVKAKVLKPVQKQVKKPVPQPKSKLKPQPKPMTKAKPLAKAKPAANAKPVVKAKPTVKPKPVLKAKPAVKAEAKTKAVLPPAGAKKAVADSASKTRTFLSKEKTSNKLKTIVESVKHMAGKVTGAAPQKSASYGTKTPMPTPVKPTQKPVLPATIPAAYHPTEKEAYMNPTMLAFFRNQLQRWRAELEMESQDAIRDLQETATFQPDMTDQASLEYDQGLELRARDRERKLIQKIDEALERIEDGSYGFCTETGEPIGVKRLLARPVATLSIEAKTLQEREEKGYAG